MHLDDKKSAAAAWFRELRDQLCAEFEAIEREYEAANPSGDSDMRSLKGIGGKEPPAIQKFTFTPWQRADGGSGEMGMMKGRVFEKVGVNISVVHGTFSEQFRHEIPGADKNPTFWAAGISLVAHMASPLVPAAHMNTRMISVGDGTRLWFGGGGDLNPAFPNDADTADFHAAFKTVCDEFDAVSRANTALSPQSGVKGWSADQPGTIKKQDAQHHASRASEPSASGAARRVGQQTNSKQPTTTSEGFYEAFTKWCDEYFYIPHRRELRGVGGIFYDYLGLNRFGSDTTPVTSGRFGKGGVTAQATAHGMAVAANTSLNWDEAFAFTQRVGTAFKDSYGSLVRRHMFESWTAEQRHQQLVKRGRYAEYNLLYDRGTRFGLMTGGNEEAILMSLPPIAIWE